MLKPIFLQLLVSTFLCGTSQLNRDDRLHANVKPVTSFSKIMLAPSVNETTFVRDGFPIRVAYKLYKHKNLLRENVKGIILLSNYDASLTSTLLVNIAQSLANENYIAAIIHHRADQGKNFSAQADTLGKDYENVWNEILTKYGGTKSKTVIGGISLAGFAISYLLNKPNSWLKGIKGAALIAASTNPYITVPVINKVCVNDPDVTDEYGNRGGTDLQNEMNAANPSIAALSSCETDNICSGHSTSDSWANFFITKIKAWLP